MQSNLHINGRAILICFAALFSLSAQAETNFRCGNYVVGAGASMAEVRAKCGEPAARHHSTQPVKYKNRWGEWVIDRSQTGSEINEWVYNFGPNRLMMELRFLDGELQDVKTLDYGH